MHEDIDDKIDRNLRKYVFDADYQLQLNHLRQTYQRLANALTRLDGSQFDKALEDAQHKLEDKDDGTKTDTSR